MIRLRPTATTFQNRVQSRAHARSPVAASTRSLPGLSECLLPHRPPPPHAGACTRSRLTQSHLSPVAASTRSLPGLAERRLPPWGLRLPMSSGVRNMGVDLSTAPPPPICSRILEVEPWRGRRGMERGGTDEERKGGGCEERVGRRGRSSPTPHLLLGHPFPSLQCLLHHALELAIIPSSLSPHLLLGNSYAPCCTMPLSSPFSLSSRSSSSLAAVYRLCTWLSSPSCALADNSAAEGGAANQSGLPCAIISGELQEN